MAAVAEVDVVIVGGGVSGLCAAKAASAMGRSVLVLEARQRLGGRARTVDGPGSADLGAAWVWDEDTSLLSLAEELGVRLHPQFGVMVGSTGQRRRFANGTAEFVQRLASGLPSESVLLDSPVRSVRRGAGGVELLTRSGRAIRARAAVLAMPPQLSAGLEHEPPLPEALAAAMRAQPTFYATAAKACLVYPDGKAFWREAAAAGALPTSAVAYELYDSCGKDGEFPCLVAFVDRSADCGEPAQVLDHIVELLASQYGELARQYAHFEFVPWADEPFTTANPEQPRDQMPSMQPELAEGVDGVIFLAGTETSSDARSLGKLESAVLSGARAGRLAAEAAAAAA